jgi:PAS domain S-box-containing protein
MLDFEKGTVLDVNRPACESLGYTREELIGMTPMDFDVNLDRPALESMAERTAAGEMLAIIRKRLFLNIGRGAAVLGCTA